MNIDAKNYAQLKELAEKHGLQTRELTSGTNGYPENLRLCITGFDSYEQAEDFAKKTGGEVTSIRRRDGWQLSESQGWVPEGYDHEELLQNDHQCDSVDFITRGNIDSYFESFKELIEQRIYDAHSFDDLTCIVNEIAVGQKAANMANKLADDEFIFILDDEVEVCKKRVTNYSHDVWTYDIAVEFYDE